MNVRTNEKYTRIVLTGAHAITVQQEWPYLDWVVREWRAFCTYGPNHGRYVQRHEAEAVAHAIAVVRTTQTDQ